MANKIRKYSFVFSGIIKVLYLQYYYQKKKKEVLGKLYILLLKNR
ncbi:MAG: hypothetical protein RMJ34_01640 [candidate division WOR-3 bacterium]|nr:hypothetical protein [candidate division WOR-3 bacterium]MDW8113623.1 hypothetical protein [candidate division WOR-3 bacterium]